MTFGFAKKILPSWKNLLLAIFAAALLILAFPDFEYWFLAWIALVPLMWAVEREKASTAKSFVLGWIFGTIFFFGTCWWLTYAPIHFALFPPLLAYSLIMIACLGAGIFPGIFSAVSSLLLRRFRSWAYLAVPFVWVATEFLRYGVTGNSWNAIGYSQAFTNSRLVTFAGVGGVAFVSFLVVLPLFLLQTPLLALIFRGPSKIGPFYEQPPANSNEEFRQPIRRSAAIYSIAVSILFFSGILLTDFILFGPPTAKPGRKKSAYLVAVQPNVPASGLDQFNWQQLRDKQFAAAQTKVDNLSTGDVILPTVVVLPESPMNFAYNDDREFQNFVNDFVRKNNFSVLFNSSEPEKGATKYFNSAVMVGPDGKQVGQYDKLYLLPFGEAVPWFLEGIVPGFVGNFAYGREYDLFPVGDAKAGVMICFESHFGQLSREYVRNGADVIIEMTNDGYLGPTPVLRQHLANAVFRAVETNRPVLRVTNVGITAYISERGEVLDAAPSYQEDTRVWSVSKSDGSQTFYVKYGDWFAWLCSILTIGLLIFGIATGRRSSPTATNNIA